MFPIEEGVERDLATEGKTVWLQGYRLEWCSHNQGMQKPLEAEAERRKGEPPEGVQLC